MHQQATSNKEKVTKRATKIRQQQSGTLGWYVQYNQDIPAQYCCDSNGTYNIKLCPTCQQEEM
jgi:hypothetical protein